MADEVARRIEAMAAQPTRWDAARTEHALAGLHRRRRRRRAALVLGTAAVLAASVVIAVRGASSPPPTVAEPPSPAPATTAVEPDPRVVRFADGSVITPLSPESTELVVSEVRPERVAVVLSAGGIAVEVAPRPERTFEVECGAVRVTVLGTGFTVERRDERTFVRVEHGRVRVSWDDGAAELGAGEEGLFPPAATTSARGEDETAPRAARPRAAAPPPAADWRPLAEQGDYDAAYAALAATDAPVEDEVETLLLAADAARLSGHGAAALPYLERAAAHEDDPRAAMARFTRGRILLSLGRAAEAAAELERVALDAPAGPLAEDALARAIEAERRAGDETRARELARRYLREHPDGRWVERAEAALGDGE